MTTTAAKPKATNRRTLRFNSLADVSAEIESLAAARELQQLGNWTSGQIFSHLARVMTYSIDGFPFKLPAILPILMGTFMKNRLLNKPMPPGFKAPKRASSMLPGPTSHEEGLAQIKTALARLQSETQRSPSPFLGKLSTDEWNKLHCRHCELHLSFLIPST